MIFSIMEKMNKIGFFSDYLFNLYGLQLQKKQHLKINDEKFFIKIFKKTNKNNY